MSDDGAYMDCVRYVTNEAMDAVTKALERDIKIMEWDRQIKQIIEEDNS